MACLTQSQLRSWHQVDQERAEEAASGAAASGAAVPAVVVDVGLAATEVSAADWGRVLSRIQYCLR